MEKINDGGPAFPRSGSGGYEAQKGLSLRDYLAAKAMQGILANPEDVGLPDRDIIYRAYSIADHALEVRKEATNGA